MPTLSVVAAIRLPADRPEPVGQNINLFNPPTDISALPSLNSYLTCEDDPRSNDHASALFSGPDVFTNPHIQCILVYIEGDYHRGAVAELYFCAACHPSSPNPFFLQAFGSEECNALRLYGPCLILKISSGQYVSCEEGDTAMLIYHTLSTLIHKIARRRAAFNRFLHNLNDSHIPVADTVGFPPAMRSFIQATNPITINCAYFSTRDGRPYTLPLALALQQDGNLSIHPESMRLFVEGQGDVSGVASFRFPFSGLWAHYGELFFVPNADRDVISPFFYHSLPRDISRTLGLTGPCFVVLKADANYISVTPEDIPTVIHDLVRHIILDAYQFNPVLQHWADTATRGNVP